MLYENILRLDLKKRGVTARMYLRRQIVIASIKYRFNQIKLVYFVQDFE